MNVERFDLRKSFLIRAAAGEAPKSLVPAGPVRCRCHNRLPGDGVPGDHGHGEIGLLQEWAEVLDKARS